MARRRRRSRRGFRRGSRRGIALIALGLLCGAAALVLWLWWGGNEAANVPYDREYPAVKTDLQVLAPELRGVWLSYLDLQNMLTGVDESTFTENFDDFVNDILAMGLSTVVVQVRPFADALYASDLFPTSHIITGTQGDPLPFDPLQIIVEKAHARGVAVHAWVNPFRVKPSNNLKLSADNVAVRWYNDKQNYPNAILEVGDGWYFNPALAVVTDLIVRGVQEIVQKYAVDGVQFDDYFYPTTDLTVDRASYDTYVTGGGNLSQNDWRVASVTGTIRAVQAGIKAVRPEVVFGVSPQGNLDNNLSTQFADVQLWMKEGYLDYICPQIYYGFQNGTQPFAETAARWSALPRAEGVKLYIGITAHKLGAKDVWAGASGEDEWLTTEDILARMVSAARRDKVDGFIFYSYQYLFRPSEAVAAQVSKEKENLRKVL